MGLLDSANNVGNTGICLLLKKEILKNQADFYDSPCVLLENLRNSILSFLIVKLGNQTSVREEEAGERQDN